MKSQDAFLRALAVSEKHTDDVLRGITTIEGKPCTIKSIEAISGGKRITYQWTADDGTTKTQTMDVMDGEKGDKGDPGNQGIQGVPGPRGTNGTAATVRVGSVISGDSPSVTNVGTQQDAILNFVLAKGDKGDKGEKGNDGQNGSSFSIRSRFATYEELIAAFPDGPDNEGDAYFVGTTASPDLYIWLVEEHEWHNNGPIAGVKGDKGDQGEEGFSPVANVTKDSNISTITVRDKTGTTTAQVKDGYSPTMSVSKTGDVITVEVTDESGTTQEILDLSGKVNTTDVGTAAYENVTGYVSPLDDDLPTSKAVYRAITAATNGIWHPSGSKTVSELTSDLLVQANVGNVYKITNSGVTTDLFIEGAGITINAGDNAVVVYASENTFKFDLQSGVVDLSGYQEKNLATAIEGETTVEGALGALSTNKASKVSGATNGNFAGLDANGNLTDSGKKASDFATAANLANYINENGAINQFDITLSNTKSVNTGGTWDGNTFTYRGLTYTVNADTGTIVITGTPTDNSFFYLLAKNIPAGRYTFGGLKDAANIVWDGGFWLYNGSVETAISTGAAGNKNDFTVDLSSYTFDRIKFGIKRKSNTLTNDTIKLFIRKADINIDVNAPYAKTNKELTEDVNSINNTNIGKETIIRISNESGTWGLWATNKFDSTTTLQDILTYLHTNRIKADKVVFYTNSNSSAFNQSLPITTGAIIEIVSTYGFPYGYWERCYVRVTSYSNGKVYYAMVANTTIQAWKEVTMS